MAKIFRCFPVEKQKDPMKANQKNLIEDINGVDGTWCSPVDNDR